MTSNSSTNSTGSTPCIDDELVYWRIERTKLLKDIRAADIPCGLSAYDIAIDYAPEDARE
jgi:hypothetical protein